MTICLFWVKIFHIFLIFDGPFCNQGRTLRFLEIGLQILRKKRLENLDGKAGFNKFDPRISAK